VKVVIVSDVHLGYENSDKEAFKSFLKSLQQDRELTDLVLLGDIVDMWRRDASGVFFENHSVIEVILELSKKATIHYVAGNHDFHVLQLKKHAYPFHFDKDLLLTDGQFKYHFLHGYEFDAAQKEPIMEALCRVMSDEVGSFESGVWATLTATWSDLQYFLATLFHKKKALKQEIDNIQLKPEERLKETRSDLKKQVASTVVPNEIIVFGHTHRPFVNKTENVVNTGSWVTDAVVHNTYAVLSNGKPRLFMFEGEEIQERVE
jgi:UDP-2,3-diacylglucosamine pyrophosphatase LpxH